MLIVAREQNGALQPSPYPSHPGGNRL